MNFFFELKKERNAKLKLLERERENMNMLYSSRASMMGGKWLRSMVYYKSSSCFFSRGARLAQSVYVV